MKQLLILFAAFAVTLSAAAQTSEPAGEEPKAALKDVSPEPSKRLTEQHEEMRRHFEKTRKQLEENREQFGKQIAEAIKQAAGNPGWPGWPGATPNDSVGKERHKQRMEQIQAHKVGYFTTQLELTAEEAQVFWPIYNEYWEKRNALFSERNKLIRKIKHDKIDDKKALQIAQRLVENVQDDANLVREYHGKLEKILSPQKLLKYYVAEESFKMELINVLRKRQK